MDVLIIERDKLLAQILADALSDASLDVTIVTDDRNAVACCEHDVPGIVITSINRHGEDMAGLQLVRAMRRRWPRLSAVYMAAFWPAQLDCATRALSAKAGSNEEVCADRA